ncbi:TetR/AcrR family transcriptional regulator [Nocardia sp. NPDC127526]|uniref:TetR/AcrR family transcriptional regulator n=1 Tax=Nocardia sp. NPDC127526 TaxID=3345393 RepID=UPI003625A8BE
MPPTAQRRRRTDKPRREVIAEAAERVLAKRGVEGLTHRAAAEEAGVPLGSTTYYFADRDDLIGAAVERMVDRYARYLEDWIAEHGSDTPHQVVESLVDAVMRCFGEEHERQTFEFELYVAAARRPGLRPLAQRFSELSLQVLAPYLEPVAARAATSAMTGLILHGMASEAPPTRAEVGAVLHYAVRTDQP